MKRKTTKITGIILTLVMLVTMLGAFSLTASAADAVTYVDRYWDENQKTVVSTPKSVSDYTVVTSDTSSYTGWCVVNSSVVFSGTVYFRDAYLILADNVTFTAPKIAFSFGADSTTSSLTVYGQTNGTGKILLTPDSGCALRIPENAHLTINGGGIGATAGLYGAGIGGDNTSTKLGKLTVNGGTITAKGGERGAGIGSGYKALEKHLDVTINGGDVTAIGGKCAPGISTGIGATVTINGGIVKATGGERGAGIGSRATTQQADNGEDAGDIVINGGDITAKGGSFGAGIGSGGYGGDNGNTIINGGLITATGGGYSAGIGGGYDGNGGSITINGGTVSATASNNGAGIGGGSGGSATILITGGKITAKGGESSAGIGGGYSGNATITITGGSVIANGGTLGTGIGSGQFAESEGSVTISGGTITATGGQYGAGIGNTYLCEHDVDIVITGGTITAIGGEQAAGVGTGTSCKNGGKITISGGTITAEGGYRAAGVGTGCSCESGVNIVITGGSLKATKGDLVDDDVGGGQFSPVNDPPSNGTSTVTLKTLTIQDVNEATAITSVNGLSGYGIEDVSTDADGKLYLYLPADAALPESIVIGETEYYSDGTGNYTTHQHSFTYTASGDTITATCQAANCPDAEQSITISAAGKIYDGTPVTATVDGSIDGVATPEITYTGNINAFTYTASITLGDATASVQFTIEKATPEADDFSGVIPGSLIYNGTAKTAFIKAKNGIIGMGNITVKYYDAEGNLVNSAPVNAGTYTIKIDVAEGENYKAVTEIEIHSFTIGKATPVVTAETLATMTYNGEEHTLAHITTTGGTLKYGLHVGEYDGMGAQPAINLTTTPPTATNAGTYTVFYLVEGDENYESVAENYIVVTIGKATPILNVISPTPSVLPGNTILLSYTLTGVKGEELTNTVAIINAKVGDLVCDIDGLKVTVHSDAVIGGEDKLVVTLRALEDGNYEDSEAIPLTLDIGMPDFTGEIAALEAKIAELNEVIEDKADADDITQSLTEITNRVKALEESGATDAELEAVKTELTTAYTDAIEDAVAELEAKIAAQIDPTELAAEIKEVTDLIDALDDTYATDAKLAEAITKAETELAAAVSVLEGKIAEEVKKLQDQITSNDTDIEGIHTSISTINGLIDALEAADEALDSRITDAINAAKSELATAVSTLEDKIAEEVKKLQDQITSNDADIEGIHTSISTINGLIDALKKADEALDGRITDAIGAAKTELEGKIQTVQDNLDAVEAELIQAIADLDAAMKAGDKALDDKIEALNAALIRAKAELEAADEANKKALITRINEASTRLDLALKQVQSNLDAAKAALNSAIANGDKTLDEKITDLGTALEAAIAALEATDAANKAALQADIDEAYATLDAAVKAVQKNLDDARAALDAKDAALEAKDGELQTFIIIVCVIASIALVGSGAFVIWFFVDRKKRV